MSNEKPFFTVHKFMVIFISIAFGAFANALIFFIGVAFFQTDGDRLVSWYIGGDHHYFVLISLGLAVLMLPLVNKIPNKLE